MEFLIYRFDDTIQDVKVIDSYTIGIVKIFITDDGRYIVQEPKLSIYAEKIYNTLLNNVRLSMELKPHTGSVLDRIIPLLEEEARNTGAFDVWSKEREAIEYYLKRNLTGYCEIDVLMNDTFIEDILSVRHDKPITIIHNKYPNIPLTTNIFFKSQEQLSELIQKLSQRYDDDPPTNLKPMVSFTDGNNARFTFTGNTEITPEGCTMSIRKPSINLITIFNLLNDNILTTLSAAYLWVMMDLKGFGLIIGAPSSGKTTLINAIFSMANPKWHYFTIEDVLELRLPHSTVSKHQTRGINLFNQENNKYSIGIFELCKLSLRCNPDFVIVGEVLGKEAEGLFQVASSGSGCISSFHATNPNDALIRLESSPISIPKINTNLISYFLHISWIERQNKRYRRILEITEPVPKYTNDVMTKQLYKIFTYDTNTDRLTVVPSKETDEIQRLVDKSQKLTRVKTILGINNMYDDLKKRISILQKIIDNNTSDSNKISKKILKYYE